MISYVAGIVLSAVLTARYVVSRQLTIRAFACYAAFYGLSFLAGLALLTLLVEVWRIPAALAPFCVVAVLTPVNFLLARLAFQPSRARPTS